MNWNHAILKFSKSSTTENALPSTHSDTHSEVSLSKSEQRKIGLELTDVGAYSFAAMISICLHELFDYHWDKKFNSHCISVLLEDLNMPKQVVETMVALTEGHGGHSVHIYTDILLREPCISGKPILLVEYLLYIAVKEGKYDARMRVLIQYFSSLFNVPVEIIDFYEDSFVQYLGSDGKEMTDKFDTPSKHGSSTKKKKIKRCALIGLTALGGGALIGLTGGLAAPLIVAGLETVVGAGSIALLSSTAGTTLIGSFFGAAGAGLTGFKMKKRVGEIEEFAFGILNGNPILNKGLHVTIAISGWLSDSENDNFSRPWGNLLNSREQYYLRYESRYLLELGKAMDYFLNLAVTIFAQEVLKFTVLSGIIAAVGWPATLMTLTSVIDNPWGVCCRRAAEVGKQLAEVLLSRKQGQRPVTLIGYSMGARVVYYCLREMSNKDGCEGIVQEAILLGTPVTGSASDWDNLTRVVSGRIVNGYCKTDYLLKIVYRTTSMKNDVAGLAAIKTSSKRINNVDLTKIVTGHGDYSSKMDEILKLIKVRTLNEAPTTFEMRKSVSEHLNLAKKTKIPIIRPVKLYDYVG
ncbi:hypothetical protein RUM43_008344 [Polyplax serrata]|uniref:Transmembrane and coiled-coil domain-containing protein 4 n=1 Tax=Polyplax serrata TaxID=468196 RepID=A0AAN8S8C8_POLSC